MKTPTWTTQTGQVIKIKEMTDSHLLNTIAMLERNAPNMLEKAILSGYGAIAMMGGEMAIMSVENDIANLESMSPEDFLDEIPEYLALVKEKNKRKL